MCQTASCLLAWRRLIAEMADLMALLRRSSSKSHIFAIVHRRTHLAISTRVRVDRRDVRATPHVLTAVLRSIVQGLVFGR